ncbi:hypothetical protein [Microbacterium sp. NPDC086615]|uniref:hypothetical protein n=1 Tax=Microbacterium sp. NPDC086615 TaxID=3154865 RepID=UPI00341BC557
MTLDRDLVEAEVGSSYHSFWVGDEEWSDERGPLEAGLFERAPQGNGIFIDTAVHTGLVPITLYAVLEPPADMSEEWQDVVRTSITLSADRIYVVPVGGLGDISELALVRAGTFGIQVAGRGREGVADESELAESYVVHLWPIEHEETTAVLRLSSPRAQNHLRLD